MKYLFLILALSFAGCTEEEKMKYDCKGQEDEVAKQVLMCSAGIVNSRYYDDTVEMCFKTMQEIYCSKIIRRGE